MYTRTHIHSHVHMNTHKHTHTHTHRHTDTHTDTHTHTHTHTHLDESHGLFVGQKGAEHQRVTQVKVSHKLTWNTMQLNADVL